MGFFGFMTIAIVCLTILVVVKMGLRHAENMKRISHGYPISEGSSHGRFTERTPDYDAARIQ